MANACMHTAAFELYGTPCPTPTKPASNRPLRLAIRLPQRAHPPRTSMKYVKYEQNRMQKCHIAARRKARSPIRPAADSLCIAIDTGYLRPDAE